VIFYLGSQTSAWTVWIPFLGSLVVAGISGIVTFLGIRRSNENNRLTIAAADDREIKKWHRETLIRLCEEATAVPRDIGLRYRDEALGAKAEKWSEYQTLNWASARRLGSLADSFAILCEDDVRTTCEAIRDSALAIRPLADEVHTQALDHADECVTYLPGYKTFYSALTGLTRKREEFVNAAKVRMREHTASP
jgi:hypothetical protein